MLVVLQRRLEVMANRGAMLALRTLLHIHNACGAVDAQHWSTIAFRIAAI